MKFIYADELKKQFNVKGHFYNIKVKGTRYMCRSLLEIKDNKLNPPTSDVIVVMMNPGRSRPVDKNYSPRFLDINELIEKKEMVDTVPDNTQYQIMRVMKKKRWKYATIINLSDLRNGNSNDFSNEITTLREKDTLFPHSIFHSKRKTELSSIKIGNNTKIIFAWGANNCLTNEAISAIKYFENQDTVYLKHKCGYPFVNHASPQKKDLKMVWVKNILNKLS